MDAENADQELQTQYVFIDTEAFIRARFDWNGRVLSRLVRFAEEGHLRLLTTEITKREVNNHIQEALADAINATTRHATVLRQLGADHVLTVLTDSGAITALENAFERFLKAMKAIDVPVTATIDALFSDYFARRPPFGDRKKAEFPDAVVVSSLRAWCKKRGAKAYVVSGDPDLKACCSISGPLLFAPSIEAIITQATVSKELLNDLEQAISENEPLRESLAEQLRGRGVEMSRWRGISLASGVVRKVDDINIHYLNVLDRQGTSFACEIEFEAGLTLELEVETEERFRSEYGYYEPPRVYSVERYCHRSFLAEVVVNFDPKAPDDVDVESVSVYKRNVEIDVDDLNTS